MAKRPEDRFASAADMSAGLLVRAGTLAGAAGADPTVMVSPATEIFEATPMAVSPASPVPAASPVQPGGHRSAGPFPRRRVLALLAVAGLAFALISSAVAGGNDNSSPPAGTGPPPTAGAVIPPEMTSTSTETTVPDGHSGKGRAKGKN
jgi:hypothetical protein